MSLVDGLNAEYFDRLEIPISHRVDVSTVNSVEFRDAMVLVTKKGRSQPAVFYSRTYDEAYLRSWGIGNSRQRQAATGGHRLQTRPLQLSHLSNIP